VQRLEEIYGVVVLGWETFVKATHETSTKCEVERLQSTVCQ